MMFDKLDKTREQAVVNAIEKIIDDKRHKPDESLNKIAADVLGKTDNMTPQLARRACEAFNKSKSVYTLQKRATEDRAEDFELLDADEVHNIMYGYHKKAASSLVMPARTSKDNIPELRKKLEKVAFETTEAPEPISIGVIEREIHRTSIRLERSVGRLNERVGMHKQASEDAIHRACQVMRRLHSKNLQKVARLAVNRYGDDGVRLVKLLGAYLGKELPIEKTANAAILPLREPYTSIAIAIDEARAFHKTNTMLSKTADVGDKLVSAGKGAAGGAYGGGKSTLKGVKSLLDPVVDFAKSPVYAELSKDVDAEDDEAFDASLRNQLQQLRATQAFVDIASDDFVKDYEIDDTMQAYNNVVGSMPDLLNEKYTPWLKALVREQLVQGNVYDANTIKQLQDIGKEIQRGRITEIDMATKQLEAGKGKTIKGLEIMKSEKEKPDKSSKPKAAKAGKSKEELELQRAKLEQEKELAETANKIKNRELSIKERQAAKRP
jgi:hypothetical protein